MILLDEAFKKEQYVRETFKVSLTYYPTLQGFETLSNTHKFLAAKRAVGSVNFIAADFNPPKNEHISFEFRMNGTYCLYLNRQYCRIICAVPTELKKRA